jgi:hypothetical protein
MGRLVEVVPTGRRILVGPEKVDQLIAVESMTSGEGQDLDQILALRKRHPVVATRRPSTSISNDPRGLIRIVG